MSQLSSKNIICPYCGETIELVIDCSIPEQEYIEDCEVCCRPINLFISVDENEKVSVFPKHENES
jgi:cysteine-rich CPXCG protein